MSFNLLGDSNITELMRNEKFSKLKSLNISSNRLYKAKTMQSVMSTAPLHQTLRVLDCSCNLLAGSLEIDMDSNLREFNLERNKLEGVAITCQMPNMRKLMLSYN